MPGIKIDSPYVGLAPFTERQARFFFGRERDQRLVVANLFAARLTVLYGPSAAGKSSLLRAGVVGELRTLMDSSRRLLGRPDLAFVYHDRWEGDVHERLCAAVRGVLRHVASDAADEIPVDARLSDLLVHAVEITQGDFFLLLDQFEEYFDYQPATNEPTLFERELARAIARPHLPVGFVIALRDDELSRLDRLKAQVPNLFSNPLRIQRLTATQARQAITLPLGEYNALPPEQRTYPGTFSIEPALVEEVIKTVKPGRTAAEQSVRTTTDADEIEAAYLQLVMTAIWNREVAAGSTALRLATLEAMDGTDAIVRKHFGAVMEQFSVDDRGIAAGMFAHLVTPSGRKIPQSLGDLAMYADVSVPVERLKPVVVRLVNGKILVSVGSETAVDAARTYTIRHDALGRAISDWQRQHVIERVRVESVEGQQVRVREAEAQAEWDRNLARQRERLATRLRYAAFALAGALVVGAGIAGYVSHRLSEKAESASIASAQATTSADAAVARARAARAEAQAAAERLATYRAELERSKADVRSFERLVQSLKSDTALNQRVAEIERVERERDDARERVAGIEKEVAGLQARIGELTRERDQAIQESREKQQPVVVLRVRPDRRKD